MTGILARTKWVARPRPADNAKLRMFCFPHVGAGGAAFNSWLDRLPTEVDVCAIRLPGRENRLREPLMDDWREVMANVHEALTPMLDLPFVVVGHCSGSVLAYEFARRLETTPELVILSSTDGPGVRRIDDPLHVLPQRELLERVVEFGGMAKQVLDDPDLMAMFERILRADYRVVERLEYTPGPPLDAPITVIGGRHDQFVTAQGLAAWSEATTREFSLHLVEAGHYILAEAGALVADIVRRLV